MREPPDKATVKYPRSLTELSESCATYSAKSVASSSYVSKILMSPLPLPVAILIDAVVQLKETAETTIKIRVRAQNNYEHETDHSI